MFQIENLPKTTFLDSKTERTLDLAQCAAQIQHAAEIVGQFAPPSATVGLIFKTGPELVLAWLGVVASGRVPLILQYPTEKMSKSYWLESVRDTVSKCGVASILCSSELAILDPGQFTCCVFIEKLDAFATVTTRCLFPSEGEILQLSSGTTGFKKPVRFSFQALTEHAARYNEVMRLTAEDHIISWLPLYHDMGFIACFVVPLLLGVPVVLIDPITWVHQPSLLFEAIERHRGSVCFMPNFGFEVMAKCGQSGPFPSMRHWISCSEASYAATLEKFGDTVGADVATISTCYGMAENVFAVTQSDGLRTIERDGQRYVSCGHPVPGTQIKEVSGEIFVRSPYSLNRYVGGDDICDSEGFYPTGDLGFIEGGQLVVQGRKQDLANIGGRKYLLNDLDYILGRIFTSAAGRIASLSFFDSLIGTEKALFLIECEDFWEWEKSPEPVRLIREATGVEWLEAHFVPPTFITKTSSGKINRRKTLTDWQACQNGFRFERRSLDSDQIALEFAKQFPGVAINLPINEELDSLGQLAAKLLCEEHGIAYSIDLTLQQLCEAATRETGPHTTKVFSIVALVDGCRLGSNAPKPFITDEFLQAIEAEVGCPVHFEQVCAPPAPILYSDLIFHDFFLPRNPDPAYAVVSSVLRKIKEASLILVDDEDNFRLPPFCSYPVLDHQFTMHPDAELLGHRMQRYTQNHHLLPRFFLHGRYIQPATINPFLGKIERYLGVPMLKMAFHASYRTYTEHWEFCDYRNFVSDAEKEQNSAWVNRFKDALVGYLRTRRGTFRHKVGEPENRIVLSDLHHFCSFLLNRSAVDYVARLYDSFCIIGLPSSLPYLQTRLEQLGKRYFFSSQLSPTDEDFECMIITGGAGRMPATQKPVFDFIHAREEGEGGGRPHNVSKEIDALCPPLAACDEEIFRVVRAKHGVLIGNNLLNLTPDLLRASA